MKAHTIIVEAVVKQETYTFQVNGCPDPMLWDVNEAKRLAADPANLFGIETMDPTVNPIEMLGIMENCAWTPERVAQADPSQPGIAVPVRDGQDVFYIVIDGTHRTVRALRDGVPFQVRLLTVEAAKRCLIVGPPQFLAWTL